MKNTTELLTSENLREMGLIGAPKGAGAHFKRFLQRKNLTAADAARDLNVAKSTITRFINGESELSIDLATKIKRVYNAPVDVFFRIDAQYKAYVVSQNISKSVA
ncbi:helix-turn-helix transcriptional regulator [Arsukibacterium sp.]|jgi:plasmid maintenance system antidote protein VapI|uniref:helix-turn-helix transcriptional regulator n=1 Tax=Arsukibacterium sp. TaxID=1977258 RepID=UPI00299DC7B4|nr:helix-turn-helix transcriptional regulator [Arsukibacterium sp.]MDX1539467.1 helix-turn-helix transcriptional regulator [Arsukibacterium sp.]